ncbi:hypothetical protein [Enemella sp. A6]|uniref:hypothetical protein n=1 Tax=Enemella sp. A6 TaxID=3440152 RepID=UPI003EBE49BD
MTTESHEPRPSSGRSAGSTAMAGIFKLQVIGVSVVGAIAVISYIVSHMVSGDLASTLRTVAYVAAAVAAVIGVSFALTGVMKR